MPGLQKAWPYRADRDQRLKFWEQAPAARLARPDAEHPMPV